MHPIKQGKHTKNITRNYTITRSNFIRYFYTSVLHLSHPFIKRQLSQKVKKEFKSKKTCNIKKSLLHREITLTKTTF